MYLLHIPVIMVVLINNKQWISRGMFGQENIEVFNMVVMTWTLFGCAMMFILSIGMKWGACKEFNYLLIVIISTVLTHTITIAPDITLTQSIILFIAKITTVVLYIVVYFGYKNRKINIS